MNIQIRKVEVAFQVSLVRFSLVGKLSFIETCHRKRLCEEWRSYACWEEGSYMNCCLGKGCRPNDIQAGRREVGSGQG